MNISNIQQIIKTKAMNLNQVYRFNFGTKDKLSTWINEEESFPVIYSVFVNSNPLSYNNGYKASIYNFELYCIFPIIQQSKEDFNNLLTNNDLNNNSEGHSILKQLYIDLQSYEDFDLLDNYYTRFDNNYGSDSLQCIVANISIEVSDDFCNL